MTMPSMWASNTLKSRMLGGSIGASSRASLSASSASAPSAIASRWAGGAEQVEHADLRRQELHLVVGRDHRSPGHAIVVDPGDAHLRPPFGSGWAGSSMVNDPLEQRAAALGLVPSLSDE